MMNYQSLIIFVFSFNRGIFLENLLKSCVNVDRSIRICIIDDNSTDPYTIEVLDRCRKNYTVLLHGVDKNRENKTGGLSGAMIMAMNFANLNEYEYALFVQDDMQFVRQVRSDDWESVRNYFECVQNSMQISTNFIRILSESSLKNSIISSDKSAYIIRPELERGKSNFSATGIFSVRRYFELFSPFEVGEGANSTKARSLGLVCGWAIYPFTCWLPYPMSFRGGKRLIVHKAMEKFGGAGFHPIEIMTPVEQKHFLDRSPEALPVMERYLRAPSAPRHDIWSTGGGEYNLLARGGFAARAWRALRKAKRFFRGVK